MFFGLGTHIRFKKGILPPHPLVTSLACGGEEGLDVLDLPSILLISFRNLYLLIVPTNLIFLCASIDDSF